MSSHQLAFTARFVEMINKSQLTIADEIFAPQLTAHVPMMPILTRSGFKSFLQGLLDAFPDLIVDINDCVWSNNKLILRASFYGTHTGDFLGISPTQHPITISSLLLFQIEQNMVIELWSEMDIISVLRQISVPRSFEGDRLASVN